VLQLGSATVTTLKAVPPGRLVIILDGTNYGEFALTTVMIDPHGDEDDEPQPYLLTLGPDFYHYAADSRTILYDLGTPTIRFDHTSLLGAREMPASGAIIDAGDAAGVFLQNSPHPGGILVSFSGKCITGIYRESGQPAFSRWEAGLMRDQKFVSLVQIDAGTPPGRG
jgi:hypothetical protein